jgi:hypothetical protein
VTIILKMTLPIFRGNCHPIARIRLFMKHPPQIDKNSRFRGSLRHYHRASSQSQRTWDEWVDGKASKSRPLVFWLKLVGGIVALLALAGVVVGLFIELS